MRFPFSIISSLALLSWYFFPLSQIFWMRMSDSAASEQAAVFLFLSPSLFSPLFPFVFQLLKHFQWTHWSLCSSSSPSLEMSPSSRNPFVKPSRNVWTSRLTVFCSFFSKKRANVDLNIPERPEELKERAMFFFYKVSTGIIWNWCTNARTRQHLKNKPIDLTYRNLVCNTLNNVNPGTESKPCPRSAINSKGDDI